MEISNFPYAFLGTSPSMSLLVNEIKGSHHCVVFNSGLLGGAWAEVPLAGSEVPLACNGIGYCGGADFENTKLEQYLVNAGAHLLRIPNPLPGRATSNQESHLVGRIIPAVLEMLSGPNVSILPIEVQEIDILPDHVVVDGEIFRGIFLPEHFKIKNLNISGSRWKLKPQTVRSYHFRASFAQKQSGSLYDVDWDSVFDRAGIQYPLRNVFVGRVRREFKSFRPEELLQTSEWLAARRALIASYDINFYDSHWISDSELNSLAEALAATTSQIVPTQDICQAFSFAKRQRGRA